MEQEADLKVFIDSVVQGLPATETRLKQIVDEQKADSVCGSASTASTASRGGQKKVTCRKTCGNNEGIFP